ncbi:MAG: MASE1 domain-containing protein [Chloroflexi bacterium]|nr:MASE1 domain-containing protein [Chloroflexota bacterium]MCI0644224.1 MASE1 domain-containing protein [Chloroflexota bacterium]MCI0727543.1 MASE1 domain-containing protein [Chloroflexota bacterium]
MNQPTRQSFESRDRHRLITNVAVVVLLGVIYVLAGKLGLALALVHPSATAVWAPTGITLAAFLVLGYRIWPAILAGAFLVNVTTAGSVATSLAIAAGNTLEGLVGARLLNRFAGGRQVFDRPQDIFKFVVLAGFMSTAVSATIGVTSLALGGLADWTDYGSIWLTWWLGDMGGALVIAPPLVLWAVEPSVRWTPRQVLEAALIVLALLLVSLTVFAGLFPNYIRSQPLEFLCILPILWAAFRLGRREAATATVLLSGIAIWGTRRGFGPFVAGDANESLLLLQAYTSVIAVTAVTLAAVVRERKQVEQTLYDSQQALQSLAEELEARVDERTEQVRRLASELITSEQMVRHHIAHTLHDNLQQVLYAAEIQLQVAKQRPGDSKELDELDEMIATAIFLTRQLTMELSPPVLRKEGLPEALEWLASHMHEMYGLQVTVAAGECRWASSEEQRVFLSQVVRELLFNIVKHAGVEEACIILQGTEEDLTITVSDQGRGFDVEQALANNNSGFGLRSVCERVALFGGRVDIDSRPEEGTRVTLFLPTAVFGPVEQTPRGT